MTFLRRIASAFPLLLAAHGFRISPRGGALNEHPASSSCLLASGFDLQRGCQYPEAMQPVPNCDSATFDQACYQVDNAETVRGYMRDVRSSSDYSSLTRSVTEAEGGGFGISVSASFSYMKRSQVSEQSLAFFIGASGKTQTRSIQRPVAMNLTSAAKALLRQDPREFITRHGLRYIHGITYGGSFLGSVTLNSRQTKSDRDIQAFASFSVNKGLFSASGSTDFQNTVSQGNLDVSLLIDAQWVGGSGIRQDYQTPETMNNMFRDWDASWRQSPAKLTIRTRRWTDSEDVQRIVNSMSAEDRDLFNSPDVTPAIRREISTENAKVTMTETSVALAINWKEIEDDRTTQSCLESVRRDTTTKLMRINLLDDGGVLMIQQQWLAGDYSWFDSDVLHDRYLNCVAAVTTTTTTNIMACAGMTAEGRTSWVQYGGDGIYADVDTANCGFEATPVYVTALGGDSSHWTSRGSSETYHASANAFRTYIYAGGITPSKANSMDWHINWIAHRPVQRAVSNAISCAGMTAAGSTRWLRYSADGIYVDVDTSRCGFTATPVYMTGMGGDTQHWTTTGSSETYHATANGFRIYIRKTGGITPSEANQKRWHVNWISRIAVQQAQSNVMSCAGMTAEGSTSWVQYSGSSDGIYVDVDTSSCGFGATPVYVTALGGDTQHWTTTGSSETYHATANGFRIYIRKTGGITPNEANQKRWHVNWIACSP